MELAAAGPRGHLEPRAALWWQLLAAALEPPLQCQGKVAVQVAVAPRPLLVRAPRDLGGPGAALLALLALASGLARPAPAT